MKKFFLTVVAVCCLAFAISSADGRTLGEAIDNLQPEQFAALGQAPRAHLEALSALSRLFALRREGAVEKPAADEEIAVQLGELAGRARQLEKLVNKRAFPVVLALQNYVVAEELQAIFRTEQESAGSPLAEAAWNWVVSIGGVVSKNEQFAASGCSLAFGYCLVGCQDHSSWWERTLCGVDCFVDFVFCILNSLPM
jgi:hypothetical protein